MGPGGEEEKGSERGKTNTLAYQFFKKRYGYDYNTMHDYDSILRQLFICRGSEPCNGFVRMYSLLHSSFCCLFVTREERERRKEFHLIKAYY